MVESSRLTRGSTTLKDEPVAKKTELANSEQSTKDPDSEFTVRQDAFIVLTSEKDLRHQEAIRIKASAYTGIALRVKVISPGSMENLLHAIDLDSGSYDKPTTN